MHAHSFVRFAAMIWLVGSIDDGVLAQDFRVYTTVVDLTNPKPGTAQISLTLFHAGKVYDYIDAAEETVIYEPAGSRFLVLNKRHSLTTEITQDEIRHYLDLAGKHARQLIHGKQSDDATAKAQIELLEFQLLPKFDIRHDDKAKTLTLSSPLVRYDVLYADPPSPDYAQAYLKSADWTAQLNAVMQPQSLLPQARLQLNEELRARNVIPVEVELQIEGEYPVHRKARHAWTWNLNGTDRQLIDHRESLLRRPNFRTIPFTDFQREMLTSAVRK